MVDTGQDFLSDALDEKPVHVGAPRMLKQSGDWGAFIESPVPVRPYDEVELTSKSGKSWTKMVEEVVWSDGSNYLVSLLDTRKKSNGAKPRAKVADGSFACPACGEFMRVSHA